ncbi:MAG: glycosyltransferase, partial [Blautia faecis]
MKILITTDWYKPIINGVVTSVLNLKKELEERGHEVRVLTLSRSYE